MKVKLKLHPIATQQAISETFRIQGVDILELLSADDITPEILRQVKRKAEGRNTLRKLVEQMDNQTTVLHFTTPRISQ